MVNSYRRPTVKPGPIVNRPRPPRDASYSGAQDGWYDSLGEPVNVRVHALSADLCV